MRNGSGSVALIRRLIGSAGYQNLEMSIIISLPIFTHRADISQRILQSRERGIERTTQIFVHILIIRQCYIGCLRHENTRKQIFRQNTALIGKGTGIQALSTISCLHAYNILHIAFRNIEGGHQAGICLRLFFLILIFQAVLDEQ